MKDADLTEACGCREIDGYDDRKSTAVMHFPSRWL